MQLYGTRNLTLRSQAYGLLERGAATHWGLSPLPPILRTSQGKPFFADFPEFQFNLSHSGSLALCALDQAPVGVDIQIIKQWRPTLPARTCSPEELHWLNTSGDFWSQFTLLWALKECRVKQSGTGLSQTIAKINVPLPQKGIDLYQLDALWFRVYSGEGWRAAACGLCPPPVEITWITL